MNRREVLSDGEIQVVHCVNRCVRPGFLCGVDELTGKNYEHRRQWMRNRLEFLAGVFGMDVLGFSVMSNHLHVILRSRPDVVKTWSDKRWLDGGGICFRLAATMMVHRQSLRIWISKR